MSKETIKLKEQEVNELSEKIAKSNSFVLFDYRGLNVAEDTKLRNEMRKANVDYKVIKNRIILRALQSRGIENFEGYLEGPTAIAISYEDAVAPAKILADLVKSSKDKVKIKAGVVEGKSLDEDGIKAVASIPAKPVLIAQLLGMLQTPLRGFAVALSEIAKKNA